MSAKRREDASSSPRIRVLNMSLIFSGEQFALLLHAADLYNRCWQSIAGWCCSHETASRKTVHEANYGRLRASYPGLPSQFVVRAIASALGAVRSWNSNHPKKRWQLRACRKALTLDYDLRLMNLRGSLLTLSTLHGEKRIRLMLPETPSWFEGRYPQRRLQAMILSLDPNSGQAIAHLIYRLTDEVTEPEGEVLGVDLGLHSLAMDSRGGEIKAGHLNKIRRRYAYDRKTLQEKGTRSAHRRMKAMKEREKRFIRDVNHCASKALVSTENVAVIAMEDLTRIRKQGNRFSKSGRTYRNMLNQWPFSQLQKFVSYKAADNGIRLVMVDPSYTSQTCSKCGHVDAKSRDCARYDCVKCGYSGNADQNAALNIRARALEQLHISG